MIALLFCMNVCQVAESVAVNAAGAGPNPMRYEVQVSIVMSGSSFIRDIPSVLMDSRRRKSPLKLMSAPG